MSKCKLTEQIMEIIKDFTDEQMERLIEYAKQILAERGA